MDQRKEEEEEKKGEEVASSTPLCINQYPSQQLIHTSSTTNSNTSKDFQALSNIGGPLFSSQ